MEFLRPFRLSEPDQVQRICYPLLSINWETPFTFDFLSFRDFQYLCVDFCASGWGTKEEFLTKALCCFWNKITCLPGSVMKIFLETLENGILDIGVRQDPTLSEGNYELFVLLFSVGILYPTIQEKIETRTPTTFHLKADELERDYNLLETDSQIFIDKIRTLFLPPEEAIKNLEEVDPLNTESFPCTRAKHPQFSGSCTVKNLNSLLSMSSRAPSIIMHGGFKCHSVYAEVFRLGDQYFALVHNLGGGSESHFVDERNKILPLALYFENKDRLMAFSKNFCRSGSIEDYLNLVEFFSLNSKNKNIEKELDRVHLKSSSMPFARSLVYPYKDRTNPMHSVYREFRKLQKEIIRKLIDPTGSPSEVKRKASDVRKIQKGQARGGQ